MPYLALATGLIKRKRAILRVLQEDADLLLRDTLLVREEVGLIGEPMLPHRELPGEAFGDGGMGIFLIELVVEEFLLAAVLGELAGGVHVQRLFAKFYN